MKRCEEGTHSEGKRSLRGVSVTSRRYRVSSSMPVSLLPCCSSSLMCLPTVISALVNYTISSEVCRWRCPEKRWNIRGCSITLKVILKGHMFTVSELPLK